MQTKQPERLEGDCELCIAGSPVYNFNRVCCCVRMILGEPRIEVRRAWMDRFSGQKSKWMFQQIEQELKTKWKKR
jgi:hypothetical protein